MSDELMGRFAPTFILDSRFSILISIKRKHHELESKMDLG
jgi:hypothetical protein